MPPSCAPSSRASPADRREPKSSGIWYCPEWASCWVPDAETLLFAAARDDHVRSVIQPALNQGIWVLCDRFSDSTRVYQGRLGQVAPAVLNAMERVTIGDLKPDVTIILDIPVEIGMKRAAARRGGGAPDRFEAEDLRFHQELRDGLPADRRGRTATMCADRCQRRRQHSCCQRMGRAARSFLYGRCRQRGQFSMSARQVEPQISVAHPRETAVFFGHREAETALLQCLSQRAYSACLADRRRAGHRQGDAGLSDGAVRARPSRSPCAAMCSVPRRLRSIRPIRSRAKSRRAPMAACSRWNAPSTTRACMRTVITVDETRETISFFGSTAAVEGWRVCIVDTVDELNPNAANALLKSSRGAAAAIALPSGQPCAGAGTADHPVSLSQIGVAAACDRRRHQAPRRRPPTSRSTIPRSRRRRRLRREASRAR